MHKIKELKVWQKAIQLAVKIYKITEELPVNEKFGLTSQIRRCSVSIASNIAEGAGRNTNGEFRQFLGIANGSAFELQTQLLITLELKFVGHEVMEEVLDNIDEIQKMIFNLQKRLGN